MPSVCFIDESTSNFYIGDENGGIDYYKKAKLEVVKSARVFRKSVPPVDKFYNSMKIFDDVSKNISSLKNYQKDKDNDDIIISSKIINKAPYNLNKSIKVSEVKEILMKNNENLVKEPRYNGHGQCSKETRYNGQLETDKCLFKPGKVSAIMEKFQNFKNTENGCSNVEKFGEEISSKNCIRKLSREEESEFSEDFENSNLGHKKLSEKNLKFDCDKISDETSKRNGDLCYSWVFGDHNEVNNFSKNFQSLKPNFQILEINPEKENFSSSNGFLKSFRKLEICDNNESCSVTTTSNDNTKILNEVLTCNVIDQQTCDWLSVKKILKRNLVEKLKPIAIIDPLTLHSSKFEGLENYKNNISFASTNSDENIQNFLPKYHEIKSKNDQNTNFFSMANPKNYFCQNQNSENEKLYENSWSEKLKVSDSVKINVEDSVDCSCNFSDEIFQNLLNVKDNNEKLNSRILSPIEELSLENDFLNLKKCENDESKNLKNIRNKNNFKDLNVDTNNHFSLTDYSKISDDSDYSEFIVQEKSSNFHKNRVNLNIDLKNQISKANIDSFEEACIFESQIFFRSNVLTQLEGQRDEKLTDLIIRLQAHCRGHLSRKKLSKLKVEDLAVRCIQRNVRKFMLIRDWPWWRLLVRVTPLLNVHRTEQELKSKTDELEALKLQFQKLEQERNTLKQENIRLDSKLSEIAVDYAEERSVSAVTGERLELENAERMRLQNELKHVQDQNKKLQESGERLEMELLCLKTADANSIAGSVEETEDIVGAGASSGSENDGVFKKRYELVVRELEFTKRRLQQQHHDDLEQLIGLRKQLEKKLADAYEEVDEQRQVVAQWKRKVQKLNSEMNDVRMLLEESNSRNNLLEKKQRKFDSELQMLQDELRQEKQTRERFSREKDMALTEKYSLEQNLSALKLDLELKDRQMEKLDKELQDISYGGNTEEDVAKLRRAKHDLEKKVAEQEEELDDLAGQVELLQQVKLRSEMNLEQIRKEHKKELAQRDEEADDARCNTQKKVKALECQLENEHEERTLLLRERHELERRLAEIEDHGRSSRSSDQESIGRLKRDLKKTRVLLHDAQLVLQQSKVDAPNKAALRQLRNQLEDAECAKNVALKARQLLETEIAEMTANLEEAQKARHDAEDRATSLSREKAQLQSQLDENEEELAEVLKKYRSTVQQLSNEQFTLSEQASRIAELESERASLKDQVAEITSRLENIETHGDPTSSLAVKRLELKTKELESKLELEQTTRARMEVQIGRLKEASEKLQHDANLARAKESTAQENVRKLQRSLREYKETQADYESKESTEVARRRETEKKLENAEAELATTKADLKLALNRVNDLQAALQNDLDDDDDNDEPSDSDNDESGSDTSLQSYLTQTSHFSINR